jgi:hypothetical protein
VHPNLATADAIIIDEEDDTPATNYDDDPHDPIVVGTSSPDPMDFLNPKPSYAFDQKKPTPMDQFSASWEEERKTPLAQDGASTQRVRLAMMKDVSRKLESAYRPDSDGDDVQLRPLLAGRSKSTAGAEVSCVQGNVKAKAAIFDRPPHVDLLAVSKQSRKNGMKPNQVGLFDLVCGTCN